MGASGDSRPKHGWCPSLIWISRTELAFESMIAFAVHEAVGLVPVGWGIDAEKAGNRGGSIAWPEEGTRPQAHAPERVSENG